MAQLPYALFKKKKKKSPAPLKNEFETKGQFSHPSVESGKFLCAH